ncbi:hypothetical protein [uncultured Sphingomonas sp.]|uniref:phage head spike fiber domain-containing protein n=1 Tax=uncultured Sphingomonas sp. TaxID=158754 RepID=UPI0025F73AE6|nr:hypothetical protein [uncultured Sphingomonas sp.]
MAKLSTLPDVAPLVGDEILPVVQGGDTRRVTLDRLRALLADLEGRRDATRARAVLYGITNAMAAALFTDRSSEWAFSEGVQRSGFIKRPTLQDTPWSYTRAGAATAPTASGPLLAFPAGTPRITDAGLLIEDASSNSARPGNDFASALWTKTGVTLQAAGAGPFGAMTRVTPVSAGFHFVGQVMESVGTVSCYARAAGVRRVGLQIESGGVTRKVVYDIVAGIVISADAGVTAWVDPGAFGSWRLVATIANAGTATVRIHALADDGADAFPAGGAAAFDLSAVQAEPGAIVTSYIDTAAIGAARAIDAASIAFAPDGDFTIFAAVDMRRAETLENAIFSLIGTAPSDRVMLLRDAAGRLALEVMNAGAARRAVGPVHAGGALRCAVSVRGPQVTAVFNGTTVLTLAVTRPAVLRTLWLGIRGTAEAALNGAIRALLTLPRSLTQEELLDMTNFPRSLTASDGTDTEAVRQMMIAHANDDATHGLGATRTAMAIADSKTGLWSIAATDAFTGTDGTPLGNTETGGFAWVNGNGIQRIGGRAKQPGGAFSGGAVDTTFSDGQIEADLYPGNGEASLVFRSNANFNQYFLLQRGGDGTVRLAYVFAQTELLSPLISMPVVAGERWKVRFCGPSILVYRIVAATETLIFEARDTRLATNVRHGFRLSGSGAVDNFRLLKRESL